MSDSFVRATCPPWLVTRICIAAVLLAVVACVMHEAGPEVFERARRPLMLAVLLLGIIASMALVAVKSDGSESK